MTVIAIHSGQASVGRITIDLDRSVVNHDDPGFPLVSRFVGHLDEIPDAEITDKTVLGSLIDADLRKDIREGLVTSITIACGTSAIFPVSTREDLRLPMGFEITVEIDGETVSAEDLALGKMLSETQRHFLSRAPRSQSRSA